MIPSELQPSENLQYLKSGKLMYFRDVLCHLHVLCISFGPLPYPRENGWFGISCYRQGMGCRRISASCFFPRVCTISRCWISWLSALWICLRAALFLYAYPIPTCKILKASVLFYSHSSTAFSHASTLFSHLSWNLSKQLSTKCTQEQENPKYTVISLNVFKALQELQNHWKL